jgi:RNA polymerase sigma-70 factor (ECF subfamily)
LTLKTVAGLSVEQIASALLAQPTALAQRLVRAKRQIRELGLTFDLPIEGELPGRLDSVLEVLYLLFNEGYAAHDGGDLIRGELCDEAIRLCSLLCNTHDLDQPHVHALLALMLLQAARLPARTDAAGELLTLERQDRSLWDQARLAEGIRALAKSARGEQLTSYHLEAGVAACHASAASYQETDWWHILELYDQLLELNPSPVVALNRAVALSQCEGPEAGIRALDAVRGNPALERYYLLWATLARLHADVNDVAQAAGYYRKALECACSAPERRFLESSLAALEQA